VAGDDTDDEGDLEADTAEPISAAHANARELGRRGDLQRAIEELELEIASHPDQPPLYADLGFFRLVKGESGRAIDALKRARALGSTSPYTCLHLGMAFRRSGDLPGAEHAFEEALVLKPAFRVARLALANVLRKQRRFDEAIAMLQDLSKVGGNTSREQALLALGKAQLASGHRKAADRSFEQAIEWVPAQAEVRIAVARAYMNEDTGQNLTKALSIATVAVQLAPDLADAHGTLGAAQELSGDASTAVDSYETALKLSPDYHYARRRLLRLALNQEDYATARQHAERLLAQAPNEPEHHFLAGLVHARADQIDEAREHYLAAVEAAHDDYPEAHFNLGLLEKGAGRIPEAIAAYQKAIAHKPGYLAALNNLGLAYAAQNDDSKAEQAYQSAIAHDPKYIPAWINLGKLRVRTQQFEAAVAAFEHAIAVRPDPHALLNLGVAYRRADRIDDAIATYRTLVAAHPRYVSAFYNLGIALEYAKRPQEARSAYERALALDPEHVGSLRRLADLLLSSGQWSAAAERYQSILDYEPNDQEARLALADVYRRLGDVESCVRAVTAALAGSNKEAKDVRARCQVARANQTLKL
jgi:tetratricopeptide (TPR) repeat protein